MIGNRGEDDFDDDDDDVRWIEWKKKQKLFPSS